jgi:3-dehydroquinate synthase
MAVVDASVGIKTAVNFGDKKNKLGTYCPPLGVLCDTALLTTLESRHISNGAAEMLKMACIKDQALFELLEAHADGLVASKFQVRDGCIISPSIVI